MKEIENTIRLEFLLVAFESFAVKRIELSLALVILTQVALLKSVTKVDGRLTNEYSLLSPTLSAHGFRKPRP